MVGPVLLLLAAIAAGVAIFVDVVAGIARPGWVAIFLLVLYWLLQNYPN